MSRTKSKHRKDDKLVPKKESVINEMLTKSSINHI